MTSYIEVAEDDETGLVRMTVEQLGGRFDGLEVDLHLTIDEALVLSEMLTDACTDDVMIEES